MATRFYFRSSNSSTGPTGEVSTDTDDFTSVPSDKNTAKEMLTSKGSSQTSSTGNYNNGGANKKTMYRIWVSPALAAQTLTGSQANYTFGIGYKESSGNMNLAQRWFAYIWRSGSGNVKTVIVPTSGTEHSTSEVECVVTATGASGDFSIEANDRFVVEGWWDIPNTKSVAYDATSYYEGTDDTMTDGTATSDAGAFFECPQTLNFPATTYSQTKSSQSRLLKVGSATKASQSRFLKTQTASKDSQSRFLKLGSLTKTSQSQFQTVTTYSQTKSSQSCFWGTAVLTKLSQSVFFGTVQLTRESLSRFLKTNTLTESSQSRLVKTQTQDKASQSRLLKTQTMTQGSRSWLGTYSPPAASTDSEFLKIYT